MSKYQPKSEAELADLVKASYNNSNTLEIIGGGTRPIGNPVTANKSVSTTALNGITLYEPGALTIVAKAGTPVVDIKKVLAKENQHLPFEPADFSKLLGTKGKPTIGSVVATANSGPRRIQVGAARDALIGVRLITGEGEIIKNGGRVMKNVTGYDLVKLMCGSHGTLGVLSDVSFKVLPMAETTNTVKISGLKDVEAIDVLSSALGSPFDVSGASHFQKSGKSNSQTLIRVEGFEKSVAYRCNQLKELISKNVPGNIEIEIENNAKLIAADWKSIKDVSAFAGKTGAVWKISVKPSDGAKFVSQLANQIDVEALYDWGGGLVWLLVDDENNAQAEIIRELMKIFVGHSTLIRASVKSRNQVEAFQPEHPRLVSISQALRAQFDPRGILNPGRMLRAANLLEAV